MGLKLFHIILFFLLLSNYCFSSNDNSQFINYSTSEGLVHDFVYNMISDRDGFIWIATSSGLSRFDSYSFKNFTHHEEDTNSIQGTAIYGLVEGKDGNIWLATDAGLECYNKITESFHLVKNKLLDKNIFMKDISVDGEGLIWLYNHNLKFVAYDPQKDSIVYHFNDYKKWGQDSLFSIYHFQANGNYLYMASNQGFASFNYKTEEFTFIEKKPQDYCHTVRKVGNSHIVATYMFIGVYIYDIAKQKGQWIEKDFIDEKTNAETTLFDAVIEEDKTVWVSVAPGLVSIKDNQVTYYNYNSRQKYFDGNVVSCFYRDTQNNLWIGSYEYGIFLKEKNNRNFRFSTRLYKEDIKRTFISSFSVFDDNSLVYTDTKGVYYCNNYKNLVIDCASKIMNAATPNIFPVDERYCMISERDTFYIYDSYNKTIKFSHFGVSPASVCADKNGVIWNGAWNGGLWGFDLKNNKKYKIYIGIVNETYYSVVSIVGDKDGSLWLGTFGAGLVHVINPVSENPVIEYYNKNGTGNHYISTNSVNCLFLDRENDLWIGTLGGGLIRHDSKTKELERFTDADGLRSNVIRAIISDRDGNIWFSSNVLSKYDIKNKKFTHYSHAEGISGSFISKACGRSASGDLLFASSSGIYVFDPYVIEDKNIISKPILTSLRISGIPVSVNNNGTENSFYTESISYCKELSLPYSSNSFSIEFASINFHEARMLRYEYMLEGVDKNWIPSDSKNRVASYTAIQPGTYTFKVRSNYGTGVWSEITTLNIKIIPPWWKTTWFRISFIIIILLLINGFIYYRYNSIKTQNIILEQQISVRTQKLVQSNELLKENQIVMEMKNSQLNEVMKSKNKLISVLAHDFRNAIGGILGISTILHKETEKLKSDKIHKFSEAIMTSSNSLVNQMMTLLDWVQSQDTDLEASPVEINLEVLLNDAINLEKGNATRKNINISTQIDYSSNAFVDPRMVSMILRNLLSNAIKFTPQEGTIIAMIQECDSGIDITVIDSGIGMPQELIDMLFNENEKIVSAHGTDNEVGLGLGLRLCKIFVEKNAGKLSVSSQIGKGSVFTVSLPKGTTAATTKGKIEHFAIDDVETKLNEKNELFTVLLIEDNSQILESINNVFDKQFNVIKALDGQVGLNFAQQMLPDIIISDINLPGKSGIEICAALKSNILTNHIPVILITSHKGEEIKDIAYNSGANDFIEKPLNPLHLIKKVETLLDFREKVGKKVREDISQQLPEDFDNKIIKRVIDFINENISDETLSTNLVAERLSISRTQLWRVFKNTTGKSLSDYIYDIRMQKATQMLLTGKYRISEIAYELGYSNPRYFTRCFSKEFGMSPSEYAERVKQS